MTIMHTHRGSARRSLPIVALLVVLIGLIVVIGLTWNSRHTELAGQQARIDRIEDRLAAVRLRDTERVDADVLRSVGVSRGRLDADAAAVSSLLETVFVWDSGSAYDQARRRLQDRFGFAQDDVFLQEFMPPARVEESADGVRRYHIDTAGVNSALGDDPDIEVVAVRADEYSYLAVVDVAITSDAVTRNSAGPETAVAHRRMLLFVTVHAEGTMSGLSGVAPEGATRESR